MGSDAKDVKTRAGVAVGDKITLPTRERMSPEAVIERFFIFFHFRPQVFRFSVV
jgi:hypothetical protein